MVSGASANPASTDVAILCGGAGTRLSPVLKDRPKPMVTIHDGPFLDILIGHLARFGFQRIILLAGFKGEVIEEYYGNREDSLDYVVSREPEPLGTGGALKFAEGLIKSDPFLLLNGDSFCAADLAGFLDFHGRHDGMASLILSEMEDASEYGSIDLDRNDRIQAFREKQPGAGLINAGIYTLDQKVMQELPQGRSVSLEYELFPGLIPKGLYGQTTTERLFDIGTPERLKIARNHL